MNTNEIKIFIAYEHQNNENDVKLSTNKIKYLIEKILLGDNILLFNSVKLWSDKLLDITDEWKEEIKFHIEKSNLFIAVVGERIKNNENWTLNEIDKASELLKPMGFYLCTDEVKILDKFIAIQYVDLYNLCPKYDEKILFDEIARTLNISIEKVKQKNKNYR